MVATTHRPWGTGVGTTLQGSLGRGFSKPFHGYGRRMRRAQNRGVRQAKLPTESHSVRHQLSRLRISLRVKSCGGGEQCTNRKVGCRFCLPTLLKAHGENPWSSGRRKLG